MKLRVLVLIAITIGMFASCRKKDPPATIPPPATDPAGKIELVFANYAGEEPLILNSAKYTNANGDTFNVTGYAYYISNVSFQTTTGNSFSEPESYHLITEGNDTSKSFAIQNIPEGAYTSITFLIGVDEARNTGGAQTGALDPINSMFWDWDTGYIMAKLEGRSPQSSDPTNTIGFHMGGFRGTESVLRWVTLHFPEPVRITATESPTIHIKSDLLSWFAAPNVIDFSQTYIIMGPGLAASQIADNYAHMFSINKVQ